MPSVRRKLIFDENLESSTKAAAREAASTIRFWFRRKYNLPITDDRYLGMTEEGMSIDYWAHYYYDKPEAEWESGTDNFDEKVAAMEAEMAMPPDDDFEDISHGQ